jgi:putative membrane protein
VHIMKRSLLITVGCGLFASVALAQTPPAGTRTPSAQDFVNKVVISDMFEIQSSQLALSKQADADTKPFAEKMVQDHQKTSSELKGLVEGSMVKLTLPTSLDSEHQHMLNELNAKSGKDFDQSYDQIQVKAHREAVALFEAYSKSGEDSELKIWAGKTLPASQGTSEHGGKAQVGASRAATSGFVAALRCNTDEQGLDRYLGLDL